MDLQAVEVQRSSITVISRLVLINDELFSNTMNQYSICHS